MGGPLFPIIPWLSGWPFAEPCTYQTPVFCRLHIWVSHKQEGRNCVGSLVLIKNAPGLPFFQHVIRLHFQAPVKVGMAMTCEQKGHVSLPEGSLKSERVIYYIIFPLLQICGSSCPAWVPEKLRGAEPPADLWSQLPVLPFWDACFCSMIQHLLTDIHTLFTFLAPGSRIVPDILWALNNYLPN